MTTQALTLNHKVQGSGAPLILVHGLFGSLENLGMIARLLAERFEVHSLDMRNHGRSPHSTVMNYQAMATDILHYMDNAGLDRASLLGHSMGGKAVMTVALRAPERVAKLIVADIAPVDYPPHHNEIFAGLQALDLTALRSRQEADTQLKAYVPELPVRQFLLKNLVKHSAGGFTWRMNLPVLIHEYASIIEGQSGEKPFLNPVLFVIGGNSSYVQRKHQEKVQTHFPGAQVRVIPGTGHWLHAEKPELFAGIVDRFLGMHEVSAK